MSDYPLFPILSEDARKEAQQLIESFKAELAKVAEETIGKLYCDTIHYIESDSWTNFTNELMEGFSNYSNSKIQRKYDFARLRKAIYENHKEEIIKDLNQDLVKEIETLKEQIEFLRRMASH